LTAETNRKRDQAAIVRRYNESPEHAKANSIRSVAMRALWADTHRAESAKANMRLIFPSEFVEGVRAIIEAEPRIRAEAVVRTVNGSGLVEILDTANRRSVPAVHRHLMLKMYRDQGCENYADFRTTALGNHRVVSVEEVEPCDHFCMTVEKWHNFGLTLRDASGAPVHRSGVFVKNSQDDDFYVPVRKGVEGTRIEVLGAPSWQHMEDVEYFQKKLFSALKVPKAYLAQDENTARAVLSSEDVRFARSVLRVQREMRNGLKKIARTHLAATKRDPYKIEFEIGMTVPSAIFELAQLEVRNARADLASRMREHVSLRWVLENVYQLTDDDIEVVIKERSEDVVRDGRAAAEVEKMSAMAQSAAQQGAGPAAEGAGRPQGMKLLERKLDALPQKLRKAITEEELNRGDREAEKRASEKLDKLIRTGDAQVRGMREQSALIRDLSYMKASGDGR